MKKYTEVIGALMVVMMCGALRADPQPNVILKEAMVQIGPDGQQQKKQHRLTGTSWYLRTMEYGDLQRKVQVIPGSVINLLITPQKKLSGSTGLSKYSGAVAMKEGNGVAFTNLEVNRKAGKAQLEAQENLYMELLEFCDSWSLKNDELTLTNKDGSITLSFKAGLSPAS